MASVARRARPCPWTAVAAAVVLAAGLIACGGSSTPNADATSPVLVAAAKTVEAGSAKVAFTGRVSSGGSAFSMTGDGAFDFTSQNGSMSVQLEGDEIPDAFGGFDLLFVDRVVYLKFPPEFAEFLPGLKTWIKMDLDEVAGRNGLPGFGSFTSQDPTSALNFLRGAGRVTTIGRESVRGEATTHYRATIDAKKAQAAAPAGARAGWEALTSKTGLTSFPMDVWIDGDGRARRVNFTMEVADLGVLGGDAAKGQKGTLTFTTDLYEFGTAVTVAAPAGDQVSDYAELQKLGGA